MSVRLTEPVPGYPVYEINHPAATARVALHGAHLMEWTPAGQAPVIYLSPDAVLQEGKAIRGGIPVCWPWFGPHPDDPSLPAHGLVRSRFWTLDSTTADTNGVQLRFVLTDDAETRKLWPHGFRLELEMHLGMELNLSLRMINTGSTPCTISGALHSYFSLGDIHQSWIGGLDGTDYLDLVDARNVHRQEGPLHFRGETDRLYQTTGLVHLHDPVLRRTLAVEGTGSGCTVVWNPWTAKSLTLPDLPDNDWLNFACVETANAWRDSIHLPPGAAHTLAARIRVMREAVD